MLHDEIKFDVPQTVFSEVYRGYEKLHKALLEGKVMLDAVLYEYAAKELGRSSAEYNEQLFGDPRVAAQVNAEVAERCGLASSNWSEHDGAKAHHIGDTRLNIFYRHLAESWVLQNEYLIQYITACLIRGAGSVVDRTEYHFGAAFEISTIATDWLREQAYSHISGPVEQFAFKVDDHFTTKIEYYGQAKCAHINIEYKIKFIGNKEREIGQLKVSMIIHEDPRLLPMFSCSMSFDVDIEDDLFLPLTYIAHAINCAKPLEIILFGGAKVGKTALVTRFRQRGFNQGYDPNIGASFHNHFNIRGMDCRAGIWDTSGGERFRAHNKQYYSSADVAILCFEVTTQDSFKEARRLSRDIKCVRSSELPVLLVATKCDLAEQRVISEQEGRALAQEIGAACYLECSALSDVGVAQVFKYAMGIFVGHEISAPDNYEELFASRPDLLWAAEHGCLQIIQWLVGHIGASLAERNDHGETALLVAAENGRLETVKWLLANGASLNETDGDENTVLLVAARNGHTNVIDWLRANGADLFWAARNGFLTSVQWLLDHGDASKLSEKDHEDNNIFHLAQLNGHNEILRYLIEFLYARMERELIGAASSGDLEVVRSLLNFPINGTS